MRYVITGATGLVGRAVMLRLLKDGHQVVVISRSASRASSLLGAEVDVVAWSDSLGIRRGLEGCDGVIHLAGEPIADRRWSKRQKKRLWESRVDLTQKLTELMECCETPPKTLISASAVGFYGDRSDPVDENDSPGVGFTSNLGLEWEKAANAASQFGVRVVNLRLGLVLARTGAFRIMDAVYRWGLGARVGDGRHGSCWIHIEDVVGLTIWALQNENVSGPVNAVAPQATTQKEVHGEFVSHYGRQWPGIVPKFMLHFVMGERARLVTHGAVVNARVASENGYSFLYPSLSKALASLTERDRYEEIQFEICDAETMVGGRRAVYRLECRARLGTGLKTVAPWFETPNNLTLMTPPFMRFKILEAQEMMEGAQISYQIDLFGLPMKWTSRIPVFEPGVRFVDTQVKGPYRLWWHEHKYHSDGVATWVYDTVHYSVPLGPLGWVAHETWVKPTLRRIFEYRIDTMHERFGQAPRTSKRISA